MAEGRVQAAQKQVGRGKLGFLVGWARFRNWVLAGQRWFWANGIGVVVRQRLVRLGLRGLGQDRSDGFVFGEKGHKAWWF